jgi:Bacterial toxin 28
VKNWIGQGCKLAYKDPSLIDRLFGTIRAEAAGCGIDIDRALSKVRNNINDHLTSSDLQGALKDLAGTPVPKPGGGFFDHLGEVRSVKRGLLNAKQLALKELQNSSLPQSEISKLNTIINEANSGLNKISNASSLI